ncbi:ATP-grasp domain-containing protein [Streptomyces sp. NPDC090052]|uniref:ATP-grasp domain-containing protein n=1 Tax=unclassified Streptomyces TaxID=2593676 RepID=UPI00325226F1|nr:ATP-grasp domain-containing protein [Streptomyces sp. NBC_01020]WSX65520.1 ATP-grasp domain-containing protein [Streptomyces sp. NBC_00932]
MTHEAAPAVLLVDPVRYGAGYKDAVRELGFTVLSVYTLDYSTGTPDHDAGDDVTLYASERAGIVSKVEATGLSVVAVVPAVEGSVYVADLVSQDLGVPGNDHGLAWARRNKAAMRARAVEAGVTVPRFQLVRSVAELPEAVRAIGFPAIVKPTMGSCSQGTTVVSDEPSLSRLAALDTHDFFGQPITEWLVEEYVRGREVAVNCYSADGGHRVVDMWEYRQPDGRDYDFPVWETLQLDESHPQWERLQSYVHQVLDAYGVAIGPSHTEVKFNHEGVYLMEIGARQPGGPAMELWSRYSEDIRPFRDSVECYLGRRPSLMDARPRFSAALGSLILRNDDAPGRLVAVHGLDKLADVPGIDKLMVDCAPGDLIPTTRDSTAIPLSAYVVGPDPATVLGTLATIRSLVTLEIDRASGAN